MDGVWVDLTALPSGEDVRYADGFSITRGRGDERSSVSPTKINLTVGNATGRYSPRNPSGPWFGLLGRNQPLRVRDPAAVSHARLYGGGTRDDGGALATDDHASLDLTGDLDVRVDLQPSTWRVDGSAPIIGKYNVVADNRSWVLLLLADGTLNFRWATDGTAASANANIRTSTAAIPVTAGRLTLRVTLDVNNGAAGHTVTFYTGTGGVGGAFTQLGAAVVTAGVTSVFSSNARVLIGAVASGVDFTTYFSGGSRLAGRIYGAQIRSSIGGTVVAEPDLTTQAPGTTSFVDGAGRTWTAVDGAHVLSDGARAHGEVASWPVRWDYAEADVRVPLEASGIMRRLSAGAKELLSPLRRFMDRQAGVRAYFPMEDGTDATAPGQAAAGGLSGTGAELQFGTDDDLPASAGVVTLSSAAATFSAPVVGHTATQFISLVWLMKLDTLPPSGSMLLELNTTGTAARVRFGVTSLGNLWLLVYASDGSILLNTGPVPGVVLTEWTAFHIGLSETTPGTIGWVLYRHAAGAGGAFASTGSFAGSLGRSSRISLLPGAENEGAKFAHVIVTDAAFPFITLDMQEAVNAHTGETADERITRLAGEEGVTARVIRASGGEDRTMRLGPQRRQTLLELLQAAADADGGVLFEPREWFGLAYRTRGALENQLRGAPARSLAYTCTAGSLEPTDDDQGVVNDVTVKREGGSSARAVQESGPLNVADPRDDPQGVGRYDVGVTLELERDSDLDGVAARMLAIGTWDEARWPVLASELASSAVDAATVSMLLALDVGDRFDLVDLPAFLPPDDVALLAQGFTERVSPHLWALSVNATPGGPYDVGVWSDVESRFDSEFSTLNASYNAGVATSLTVAVAARRMLWTTTAGHFPFDLNVAGARVRVTNITGASSPQTFTVQAATVNGVAKVIPAGTPVRLWKQARYAL